MSEGGLCGTRCGPWFTVRAEGRDGLRVAKLIALCRSPEVRQLILGCFGATIIPAW